VKDGLGWTLLQNAAYNGDMDIVSSGQIYFSYIYWRRICLLKYFNFTSETDLCSNSIARIFKRGKTGVNAAYNGDMDMVRPDLTECIG
jgi:hypothetical protein